jgi:hypothetical protein
MNHTTITRHLPHAALAAAALALAGCAAVAPGISRGRQLDWKQQNGKELNGTRLNGGGQFGYQTNGKEINGTQHNGAFTVSGVELRGSQLIQR